MTQWWPALLGYAIGSLPIGYLIVRAGRGVDLRRVGSGNVGATNVYRSAGWRLGVAVLAIDMTKGAASVLLSGGGDGALAAGIGAVVGQVFPVWLGFQGGKGVATATGAFAILAPWPTAVSALVFAVTLALTRYVSLGSLLAAGALPLALWASGGPRGVVIGATGVAGLVVARHRDNIKRLRSRTERTVGA